MKTVREVAKISGLSVRTLHYYDSIGLLRPAKVTDAGYRLYDGESLARLRSVMLFRELGFPLAEIGKILGSPDFDADAALVGQIELLEMKRERIDRMILLARKLKNKGEVNMDFSAFDDAKEKEYAKKAKEKWGQTAAYREFEAKKLTKDDMNDKNARMMEIFARFGQLREGKPEDAQALVGELRAFITENFYNCTVEILAGLGQMYGTGGEFTENIDKAGGEGTARFAARAIEIYCKNK